MLLNAACNEQFLDVQPVVPSTDTYYNNQEQLDGGIIGTYSKLVYFYNYRGFAGGAYLHDARLLPDDDLTTYAANARETFTYSPADDKNLAYFRYLYELNARANTILSVLETKGDAIYQNKLLRTYHKGEALFLRGYSHFLIWNFYGIAPLINDSSEKTLYPTNSENLELLDAAIQDFLAAADLLPDSWSAINLTANVGRATRGAANGMAGKALLFRGTVLQSTEDLDRAYNVLSTLSGYSLVPVFYDNFDPNTENNSESVFEVQLGANANNPEGSNPWLPNDDFAGNGDISNYFGYFDGHWSAFGERMIATSSIMGEFDVNDKRLRDTFDPVTGAVLKYVKPVPNLKGYFDPSYNANARVLRFSDILLLKSEALIRSGGDLQEAILLINLVRQRANPNEASFLRDVSETDRTKVMQWLIQERRLELAFEEGHRWFDLRRWHLGGVLREIYGKDLTSGWDFSSVQSCFFSEKNLFYPIPWEEIGLNPNLKQHPLWIQ
jgi:starch-binding outer membrane protein, SusD/RagB family